MKNTDEVQLLQTMLYKGFRYAVDYTDEGAAITYTGRLNDWDALSDVFLFKNDDNPAEMLRVKGDDVLGIRECPKTQSETDPSGKDAHAPGAKLDAGKVYADAILSGFPHALWGVAEVGTFGANKYSLGGWQSVEDGVRRYRDAAARHRLKRQMGETIDPDSGLPHTYHEAWNVLASLELELRED